MFLVQTLCVVRMLLFVMWFLYAFIFSSFGDYNDKIQLVSMKTGGISSTISKKK